MKHFWTYAGESGTTLNRISGVKMARIRDLLSNVIKKLFVAFPWVETSTGPGGFMICVFINMTGTPEGSTESGFMEKPGIEPATPGLQGIALIHYTTGAYIGRHIIIISFLVDFLRSYRYKCIKFYICIDFDKVKVRIVIRIFFTNFEQSYTPLIDECQKFLFLINNLRTNG